MFDQDLLALAPLWYAAFLLSITCHEAAHAWAALLGGDDTAARGGQVTLDPVPHIRREPFGTIVMPLLSLFLTGWMIGWASAPFDPYWQQRHPRRAAWMALAGPSANLALALLAAILIHAGIAAGWLAPPAAIGFTRIVDPAGEGLIEGVAVFLSILFSQNLLLMAFNLIPVPPLDGATAVGVLLPERAALKFYGFMQQPGFGLLGLLLAWQVFGRIFSPFFYGAVRLLYGVI